MRTTGLPLAQAVCDFGVFSLPARKLVVYCDTTWPQDPQTFLKLKKADVFNHQPTLVFLKVCVGLLDGDLLN